MISPRSTAGGTRIATGCAWITPNFENNLSMSAASEKLHSALLHAWEGLRMFEYKMRKVGQTLEIEHLVYGWVSMIAANPERVLMERRDPVSGHPPATTPENLRWWDT